MVATISLLVATTRIILGHIEATLRETTTMRTTTKRILGHIGATLRATWSDAGAAEVLPQSQVVFRCLCSNAVWSAVTFGGCNVVLSLLSPPTGVHCYPFLPFLLPFFSFPTFSPPILFLSYFLPFLLLFFSFPTFYSLVCWCDPVLAAGLVVRSVSDIETGLSSIC